MVGDAVVGLRMDENVETLRRHPLFHLVQAPLVFGVVERARPHDDTLRFDHLDRVHVRVFLSIYFRRSARRGQRRVERLGESVDLGCHPCRDTTFANVSASGPSEVKNPAMRGFLLSA